VASLSSSGHSPLNEGSTWIGAVAAAYPVDSGFPRCSVLSDRIGAAARTDTDGEGSVARGKELRALRRPFPAERCGVACKPGHIVRRSRYAGCVAISDSVLTACEHKKRPHSERPGSERGH